MLRNASLAVRLSRYFMPHLPPSRMPHGSEEALFEIAFMREMGIAANHSDSSLSTPMPVRKRPA